MEFVNQRHLAVRPQSGMIERNVFSGNLMNYSYYSNVNRLSFWNDWVPAHWYSWDAEWRMTLAQQTFNLQLMRARRSSLKEYRGRIVEHAPAGWRYFETAPIDPWPTQRRHLYLITFDFYISAAILSPIFPFTRSPPLSDYWWPIRKYLPDR